MSHSKLQTVWKPKMMYIWILYTIIICTFSQMTIVTAKEEGMTTTTTTTTPRSTTILKRRELGRDARVKEDEYKYKQRNNVKKQKSSTLSPSSYPTSTSTNSPSLQSEQQPYHPRLEPDKNSTVIKLTFPPTSIAVSNAPSLTPTGKPPSHSPKFISTTTTPTMTPTLITSIPSTSTPTTSTPTTSNPTSPPPSQWPTGAPTTITPTSAPTKKTVVEVPLQFSDITLKLFMGEFQIRKRNLLVDSQILNPLIIYTRSFMNHVLEGVFRKDGYEMITLYIVAVNSELTQTKYINAPVDTLLFHMSGVISFDDRNVPTEHYITERILELFNTHNNKNDYLHLLQGSSITQLKRVFDVTSEKHIKKIPVITNSEEYQTNENNRNDILRTPPTQDIPPSRRGEGRAKRTIITGGITLSVGLFFLASLVLMYIFVHTRKRPEKLEDGNTVESSCDLEGARSDIVVAVKESTLPQPPPPPICGLSVDIAPSIMKELEQISPLRDSYRHDNNNNSNKERRNQKRMFSKSKKKRYNTRRRGADLELKLDTIEEDNLSSSSSSHSSSKYYTDTTRSEVETDDDTVEQQHTFSLERYANVATVCDEDCNLPVVSKLQEDEKPHNVISNMPETKESMDKELHKNEPTTTTTENKKSPENNDETKSEHSTPNECVMGVVKPNLTSISNEHASKEDKESNNNSNLAQSECATSVIDNENKVISSTNETNEETSSSTVDEKSILNEQPNENNLVSKEVPNHVSKDDNTNKLEALIPTPKLDDSQESSDLPNNNDENKIETTTPSITSDLDQIKTTINDNYHQPDKEGNETSIISSSSSYNSSIDTSPMSHTAALINSDPLSSPTKNTDIKNESVSPEMIRDTRLPLFEI